MALTWYRTAQLGGNYHLGAVWMAAIPSGATIRRVRFSWGFNGFTSSIADMSYTLFNHIAMGLVTTIGNGTEAVPAALTASGDAAPPTQRWIWWETRIPIVTGVDEAAGIVTWRDSGHQESIDARAQVKATGIPGGDTLNLWGSWESNYGWDATGQTAVYMATSVLYG